MRVQEVSPERISRDPPKEERRQSVESGFGSQEFLEEITKEEETKKCDVETKQEVPVKTEHDPQKYVNNLIKDMKNLSIDTRGKDSKNRSNHRHDPLTPNYPSWRQHSPLTESSTTTSPKEGSFGGNNYQTTGRVSYNISPSESVFLEDNHRFNVVDLNQNTMSFHGRISPISTESNITYSSNNSPLSPDDNSFIQSPHSSLSSPSSNSPIRDGFQNYNHTEATNKNLLAGGRSYLNPESNGFSSLYQSQTSPVPNTNCSLNIQNIGTSLNYENQNNSISNTGLYCKTQNIESSANYQNHANPHGFDSLNLLHANTHTFSKIQNIEASPNYPMQSSSNYYGKVQNSNLNYCPNILSNGNSPNYLNEDVQNSNDYLQSENIEPNPSYISQNNGNNSHLNIPSIIGDCLSLTMEDLPDLKPDIENMLHVIENEISDNSDVELSGNNELDENFLHSIILEVPLPVLKHQKTPKERMREIADKKLEVKRGFWAEYTLLDSYHSTNKQGLNILQEIIQKRKQDYLIEIFVAVSVLVKYSEPAEVKKVFEKNPQVLSLAKDMKNQLLIDYLTEIYEENDKKIVTHRNIF